MTPEALSREGSPAPPTMLGLPQTATMAGGEITLHAAPAVVEEVTTTAGGPHFLGKTLEVKTTNFTGKKSYFPHSGCFLLIKSVGLFNMRKVQLKSIDKYCITNENETLHGIKF